MIIEGKSKVQLFEGNKLVHEQSNKNIVTNAIRNIINPDPNYLCGDGMKLVDLINKITPIQTVGLGGIILYDENIPEDPDITYMPAGVGSVGHAGSAYSGTNPYRGTYNANESGVIEGGYRHVWDFGTDKANGTIKCLGLTSKRGGNHGFNTTDSDNITCSELLTVVCSSSKNYPLAEVSDNRYCHISSTQSSIVFTWFSSFDKSNLKLNEVLNTSNYTTIATKTISVNNANDVARFVVAEDAQTATLCLWTAVNSIVRTIIDIQTGTLISQTTLTLVGIPDGYTASNSSYTHAYANGMDLYVAIRRTAGNNEYWWARFEISGDTAEFKTIIVQVLDYSTSKYAYLINGRLVIIIMVGNSSYYQSFDKDKYTYERMEGLTPRTTLKKQLPIVIGVRGFGPQNIDLGILYNYLGTINNLATPVTKTAAQSMKITYEIREG